MTNFKKTKRALLGSAMALFVCFAMLAGTTFAWFTDSATSSGNIIKTGTLDVGMYWADGTEVVPSADADWTDASTGAIFNHDKWEPGYVEVRHIKISNEGTLALKYQISIVANGTISDLVDAIDVYYVDPAQQISDRADLADSYKIGTLGQVLAGMQTTAGGELAADEDHTVTLALKMRENAENKYQGKSLGSSFSVVLVATQLAAETDAFDNKYDENAEYPEVEITNTQKQEGVASTLGTPDEAVNVDIPAGAPAGNYDLEVSDKSVNTDENGNTTVSMDIELKYNGGEADDQYAYTVSVNVGAGLNITKVVHADTEIPATDYTYNPVTGVITFTTNSFSPFSFTYNNEATSVSTFEELKAAVANGGLITLAADVTASETLVVNKGTVIDGNGFKLTSSAARAINVSGADGVVIKNLVIECTGERAINVIQNATNVVVDSVTATAYNYTVNVASSAPGAIVTVKNSTLNGLCTVNVSAVNAEVSVIDSTVNCNDNNTTAGEGYAALSLNMEAKGAKIIATGSTINVVEGSDSVKGRNGAENGVVTIDGSTDEVLVTVAAITYSGSPYYYTFTSLAEAVKFASAGDTVSLIRDVKLDATIAIDKAITLDLGGYKVTTTAQKAFEIYADAVIMNGTIEAGQRCVDTRKAVELTLTNVTLVADKYVSAYGNPQPLTIGGSENGTKVTMTDVSISAKAGYGIITFVTTEMTATNCDISGYSALYVKPGSENSTFDFVNCDLTGSTGDNDVEGNSFSAVAVRANGCTLNFDADSTIVAKGNYCYVISFTSEYPGETQVQGVTVNVEGKVIGNVIYDDDDVVNNTLNIK